MKNNLIQRSKDYGRVQKAIHFLEDNFQHQPSLRQMAENSNVSEYHFHRIFQRWAGISPKRFVQYLTKEYAKQLLKDSNVLDVSYAAGLSGPSRLHDLFVNCEGMSPGEYKQKAKGLVINYGFHPTPLGECFIALTDRGLCNLSFIDKTDRKKFIEDFCKSWKNAKFHRDQERTGNYVKLIFASRGSKKPPGPIKVICKGTNFQIKVWEALLKIPSGNVVTYKTIAEMIGHPRAVRAVGNAVGKNPIAYLIPCHRVIRGAGHIGGYRWGITRKRAILGMEAVHRNDT
jgi:AraC family transcriptional regulator of adaptative response/methylated-DNA-[protein]-cysteine methyltransferase